MERPATMIFNSPILSRMDTTGKLPSDNKYEIGYAQSEKLDVDEGALICQYFSHYLFFIEVIEFKLNKPLKARYQLTRSSLFLFFVLDGKIDFSTIDDEPITGAKKGICYVTYTKEGEYQYSLSKGEHRICYLCPRASWITKNLNYYPRLKPFMQSMLEENKLYGLMAACQMNGSIYDNLNELFSLVHTENTDLETQQTRSVKKLISEYQRLVDSKFAQKVYIVRDYLEANYMDPEISNQQLASAFYITEKTLIENFKEEFNTTPYTYLIQIRMQHAKSMLANREHVNEVYGKVGYKDVHSFSTQFKKFFGYPPSKGRILPSVFYF